MATAMVACLALTMLLRPATTRAEQVYRDGSFGVSMNLPDNTSVSRIKSPAGETGTEIGQFTLSDGKTVGRIVVSDLPDNWTFAKAMQLVREQLARDSKVPDAQITSDAVKVKGNYKSATLLQAWDEEHKMHNAILIVQGPSDQMLLLYVAVLHVPQESARKTARQLAESFNVLLKPKDEEKLQAAIARGAAMLMGIAAPLPRADDLWQNRHFLIQGEQDAYGYIVVSESLKEDRGRSGLAMRSEKWVFWPKGGAEYERQTAYASWDLREDEWNSHGETVIETGGTARLIASDQKVLRLGQQLLVEATDPKNPGKKINRVLPAPRSIMPAAWRWILPRLMLNRAQSDEVPAGEWLAIVAYSPLRRGLETQMLSRATHGAIRQILQREGFYGDTETWNFDTTGTLRSISATGFTLVPTTEAEVKRLFGSRITLWRDKLKTRQ